MPSYLRPSKKNLLFSVHYITISEVLLRVVIDQKYIQHETLFPAASYYDLLNPGLCKVRHLESIFFDPQTPLADKPVA